MEDWKVRMKADRRNLTRLNSMFKDLDSKKPSAFIHKALYVQILYEMSMAARSRRDPWGFGKLYKSKKDNNKTR